jgi:hypothetical protein
MKRRKDPARKPSLKTRASSSKPAVKRATMPINATYFSLASGTARESELEKIAAVAESADTDEMARRAENREADG